MPIPTAIATLRFLRRRAESALVAAHAGMRGATGGTAQPVKYPVGGWPHSEQQNKFLTKKVLLVFILASLNSRYPPIVPGTSITITMGLSNMHLLIVSQHNV